MMNLKKGDIIDVITPASAISREELVKISQFLEKKGLKTRFFMEKELVLDEKPPHLFSIASAETRFKQLKMALESDSKVVWCARGGYGSADLIPFLALETQRLQDKNFIGFSDITSLTIFLQQQWNFEIIAAPMLAQLAFGKVSKKSEDAIFTLLFSEEYSLEYDILPLNLQDLETKIEGILTGGCLSVIMQSLGTLNQIDWHDKILFLEDIDEKGEKLDRFFTQILQIIKHQDSCPKAILLGNFAQNVRDKQKKANIKMAIVEFVNKIEKNGLDIRIFEEKSQCLGHTRNMMPLLIGAEVEIYDGKLVICN